MNENCNEIWADIKDYEGLYQVSNLGRVKSLSKNKNLSISTNPRGYYAVALIKDSISKSMTVHRLVAYAFIGSVLGLHVEHVNKDKTDNNWINLKIKPYTSKIKSSVEWEGKSSKYKGVGWDKTANKWRARRSIKGKVICLALFNTELEAALYYDRRTEERYPLEGYTTNKSLGLL